MVSLWKSILSAIGSDSSHIPGTETVVNPLPPCPTSPNCVRITKIIDAPVNAVLQASIETMNAMRVEELNIEQSNFKINAVFKVFFFRDDMTVQLSRKDSASTYLHVRSASRVGFSDLGVNTRRVKRFLKRLEKELS